MSDSESRTLIIAFFIVAAIGIGVTVWQGPQRSEAGLAYEISLESDSDGACISSTVTCKEIGNWHCYCQTASGSECTFEPGHQLDKSCT